MGRRDFGACALLVGGLASMGWPRRAAARERGGAGPFGPALCDAPKFAATYTLRKEAR